MSEQPPTPEVEPPAKLTGLLLSEAWSFSANRRVRVTEGVHAGEVGVVLAGWRDGPHTFALLYLPTRGLVEIDPAHAVMVPRKGVNDPP